MLYANFVTEAVQYGIESGEKAVGLYIKDMKQKQISVEMGDVFTLGNFDLKLGQRNVH